MSGEIGNFLSILTAAIVYYLLGAFWYSPLLFGNAWMKLAGLSVEEITRERRVGKVYGGTLLLSFLMVFILSHFVELSRAHRFGSGALVGFWCWTGFFLALYIIQGLFQHESGKLLAINSGYNLIGLLLAGGILGAWH